MGCCGQGTRFEVMLPVAEIDKEVGTTACLTSHKSNELWFFCNSVLDWNKVKNLQTRQEMCHSRRSHFAMIFRCRRRISYLLNKLTMPTSHHPSEQDVRFG